MKILVVDDHEMIRDGLRPALETLAAGEALVVLEAATLAAALRIAGVERDIDLVLLDLHLPDARGLAALGEMRRTNASLPIVVISGEDDPAVVREALAQGALGYVPKSSNLRVIAGALQLVLAGGVYVPQQAMAAPATAATRADAALGLTPRQDEVLALLLAGKSNKAIGRELDLAEGTVKNHVAAVLKALGVTTRTQAVIAAAKRGIKV
jgi:DNA-binding NarL/FixJ family response regulator